MRTVTTRWPAVAVGVAAVAMTWPSSADDLVIRNEAGEMRVSEPHTNSDDGPNTDRESR
jgi:hypothetical protein